MDLMQSPFAPKPMILASGFDIYTQPPLQVKQMSLGQWMPKADAATWVTRDRQTGEAQVIRVVDMTDAHLWRWIRYFRKKYRGQDFAGSDLQLDAFIRLQIVTAPAIYARAAQRGVMTLEVSPDEVSANSLTCPRPSQLAAPEPEPGKRHIDLED